LKIAFTQHTNRPLPVFFGPPGNSIQPLFNR
jgi:hypothetical protein